MGKVKNFLSNYQNRNTYDNHRKALQNFFTSIYGKFSRDRLDEMGDRYFIENRDIEQDLQKFMVFMKEYAPLTQRNRMSSVKTFLMENNIEFPQKFWKKLTRRIKGSRALTLDKIPSNKELRKILTHMPVHGKSLFLLLESSGIRIGEASKLKLNDLMLDEEPMRIQIRGEYTKTGNSRYAFASRETKETIREWLKVRQDYLTAASGKSHKYGKSTEDDRLFPFRKTTSYIIWQGALKKAKLDSRDNSTNVRKFHPHVLRKFFRTRLGAVIPVDVVEALMGHEGYLTEVYRRYTVEDLAKFYLQGESALLVFTEAQEVTKLRQEVEERNKTLQTLVNGLTSENLELKSRVSRVEMENTEMKKRVKSLETVIPEMRKLREKLAELLQQET
jgi:integrase